METKYCENCKETKELAKFQLNEDGSIRKHICKLCYGRKYRAQLKLEMLETFGWKCQCCGEAHPYFLSLDHIDESGSEHRAKYESSNNNLVIADAKREGWPKDKYQLLCMNCNTAKGYYGECPHKTGKSAEDIITEMKAKIFHTGKSLQSKKNKGLKQGPKILHERAIERNKMAADTELKSILQQFNKNPEEVIKFLSLLQGP